jgi:hypothetical protein
MIVWTDYFQYRARLRRFDLGEVERILMSSTEWYFDTLTERRVAVGRHAGTLVMVPCERAGDDIVPVTIHTTTRQQINLRVRSGRFLHE